MASSVTGFLGIKDRDWLFLESEENDMSNIFKTGLHRTIRTLRYIDRETLRGFEHVFPYNEARTRPDSPPRSRRR